MARQFTTQDLNRATCARLQARKGAYICERRDIVDGTLFFRATYRKYDRAFETAGDTPEEAREKLVNLVGEHVLDMIALANFIL